MSAKLKNSKSQHYCKETSWAGHPQSWSSIRKDPEYRQKFTGQIECERLSWIQKGIDNEPIDNIHVEEDIKCFEKENVDFCRVAEGYQQCSMLIKRCLSVAVDPRSPQRREFDRLGQRSSQHSAIKFPKCQKLKLS